MRDKPKIVKRNVRDSVFTHLFQEPKYILQLYNVLHPEDKDISEDMIEIVTLKNVLIDNMYNDLGFTVGKRLMVLVEAQSTWTVNIILRGLLYLVQTYKDYIEKEEFNIYSSTRIDIPKPELYVIYTGDKKVEEGYISLSEEFFGGEETALEVKVKVICDDGKENIISQYITFTKIYGEQCKIYGRTREAILETIRICKDKNILKEYLSDRTREVYDIMFALFDDEYIFKAHEKEVMKKGIERGIEQGIERGIEQGIERGIEKGKQKNIQEIAYRMFKKNEADDYIIDLLNISPDELNQLKTEYYRV